MFDRTKNKSTGMPMSQSNVPHSDTGTITASTAEDVAIIGSSIVIKGEIRGGQDIVIEGQVEGAINLNGHQVSIGQSGDVNADIQASVVQIDGKVSGDVCANEKVIISRSGNVNGNIVAPRVMLEDGAIFKGSIDMDPAGIAEKKTPRATQQPANSAGTQVTSPGLDLKSV